MTMSRNKSLDSGTFQWKREDDKCRLSASGDKGWGWLCFIKWGEACVRFLKRSSMAVTTSFHPVCWGLVYSLESYCRSFTK